VSLGQLGRVATLGPGLVLLTLGGASCQRRSPGPQECRDFALAVAGVRTREELHPRHLPQLDNLTRECLVTPYDRTMLRCVEESGQIAACHREFLRRRAER